MEELAERRAKARELFEGWLDAYQKLRHECLLFNEYYEEQIEGMSIFDRDYLDGLVETLISAARQVTCESPEDVQGYHDEWESDVRTALKILSIGEQT